jgi:LacI family transcriptional regulator
MHVFSYALQQHVAHLAKDSSEILDYSLILLSPLSIFWGISRASAAFLGDGATSRSLSTRYPVFASYFCALHSPVACRHAVGRHEIDPGFQKTIADLADSPATRCTSLPSFSGGVTALPMGGYPRDIGQNAAAAANVIHFEYPIEQMSKPMPDVPTIREVAKLARVGLMTVSRVINDHPSVRPSTRKKVEVAIAQLGYQQNEAARLLKGRRSKIIGLIVPDLSDAFFASCAHTVQQIARAHGYMTLVVASERDPELEVAQAELMAKRRISGLLLVSSIKESDERLKRLQNSDLPIVAFDRPLAGLNTDAVLVENRAGAEEAIRHLLTHGHQRIACVGYDEDVYTVRERVEGYRNTVQTAQLKPQIALGIKTIEDVRSWLGEALASKTRPTAVFSLNHRTSAFLLQALAERSVAIPGQMAIIGFDDFHLASVLSPPLTTVAQFPIELAGRSMHLLLERIGSHKTDTPQESAKIFLPVRLIIRGSCGEHTDSAFASLPSC